MTTFTLNHPIIDLTSSAYGSRVTFGNTPIVVNPRNKLGKIGIKTHNWFTKFFHQTISVKSTDKSETFYLNKKSAFKWVRALNSKTDIDEKSPSALVAIRIHDMLTHPPKTLKQTHVNNYTVSKVNKLRGQFRQSLFNFTKETWLRFKARFFIIKSSERTLKRCSELAAISQFYTAKEEVPAYKKFLENRNPTQFSEVPITSKENYIKPSMSSQDNGLGLYKGGIIPPGSKNDTSTGTTGEPTQWYRGPAEQKSVEKLSSYAAKAILGTQPYYFINGFALGQWASGTTAFAATKNDGNATVSNPGMDVTKIFASIKQAVKVIPAGHPIVVAGYPPHLAEVVELALKEGFDLSQHNIIGVVGGEGISEGKREQIVEQKNADGKIIRQGFKRCYSSYGASDLDINIGYESDFEVELRKICHSNPTLSAELFGDNGSIPMIFHYDPLNYHIETNEEEHLIFTCSRNDRISPRVRYDLGDKGKVMACSDLVATLKKHGITLPHMPRTELPFIFVWGRGDSMISYRGANVAPENLEAAIQKTGLADKIAHFAFFQYEKDKSTITELMIEPKSGINLPPDVLTTLINQMKEINPDFKKQIEECRDETALPKLRLFEPGTSPMALQRAKYPHLKKKYIYLEKAGDEFTSSHLSLGGKLQSNQSSNE